ncbi:TonB-dependent receptor [Cognatilysobacter terrigena]|uniref:TonB-dependent receptor n=1 Tax=Cognatilysobacter terrigena TaxID=2488749 RepID=UPI00105E3277|nr:TonB-dependent receptor [Lysobacter terrigena]
MLNLKRNLLSVALASSAMMLATAAQAQTATPAATKTPDAQELDSVVVKGIRRGIERSIDTKKNSTSIVEAVSAEDIGKLPDISIAESIGRLPGVAAQRVAGRAQVISVRGLSPDFSTSLMNGHEMVSTGDNRSVEFDQYPAELLSGVTVYKTPDAGLIGQGLSGTVDMRTVRPLDFQDQVISVGARAQYNSLGSAANTDAFGNRINASFITQSADRTFGFSIGYSHSDTPTQENQVGLYEPWQQLGAGWRPGVPAGTYYSDGIKALRRTGDTKRDGVMATLELRPNDMWHSVMDLFYSKAHAEDTANQFEVNLGGYNGGYSPGLNVTGAQVNGNGTFTGGTVTGVYPLVRGMYNDRRDTIKAFAWNNTFKFDNVKFFTDVSWSKADRNELSLENNLQLQPTPTNSQLDTLHLAYSSGDFSQINPTLTYNDPSKLYLTNTIYGSGYGKVPSVRDELVSVRVGANIAAPESLSWFSDFDVGFNYADREKEKHQPEASTILGPQGPVVIPSDLQYGTVDLGFAGVGIIPAWNVPGVVSRFMTFDPSETAAGYLVAKAWTVNEKIGTTYFKANIDTQWGSVPVRGNVGIQAVHTDQSSSANVFDGSRPAGQQIVPYTRGKSYTDWLPSLNLAFSLPADQTIRVALAKQMARPRVDELRASRDFGVDTTKTPPKPGASGGNPELDPWRANAFDISYEKYFGTKAYVAAAYFYKDLSTYIYTQTVDNYDFSDLLVGYVPPAGTGVPQSTGNFTAPFNGKGGKLQGVELTASLPLNLFTDALDGFGIVTSATFNDSSVQILAPDSASSVGNKPIDLPGLSKRVYNFMAYYEKNGFEARVNQRRRSDFIGEIGNFAGNRTLRYVVGENITDAQVSYSFGDATSLKGLTLLLQVNNLTNSAYRTYAESKDRPLEYVEWGRTYLVGVNYKF